MTGEINFPADLIEKCVLVDQIFTELASNKSNWLARNATDFNDNNKNNFKNQIN